MTVLKSLTSTIMKFLVALLVALMGSFNYAEIQADVEMRGSERVYGGYPIEISDAPYMAHVNYLLYQNSTYGLASLCGGTIIKRQYILTAGHFKHNESCQ